MRTPKEVQETSPLHHVYLVVCPNGFARGVLHEIQAEPPKGHSMVELHNCAQLRNRMCSCGGKKHRIVRAVQVGTGVEIG